MSALVDTVRSFLAKRDEYVHVLRQCVEAESDYHRWQGHAEARRQLTDALAKAGVDLSVETLPQLAVSRAVAESIVKEAKEHAVEGQVRLTELIHIANSVTWTDAEHLDAIRAETLRDAARAKREIGRNSGTRDGYYEAESEADWLDERATRIDPRRIEGAHP